ncbi:MAG: DNA polymerase III subunit beta [Clostridiales bacterium]|jgi:DNA polymerase-3 subunit beta|nr:DNA polymerase III subunit beta [Clostridiales bacterium]
MKFVCERDIFQTAVGTAIKAAATGTLAQITSAVHITARKDKTITLTCNNLEISIDYTVEASGVSKEGTGAIPAKILGDMVRKFTADNVTVQCDDKHNFTIDCGKAHFEINGLDPAEFALPSEIAPEYSISVKGETLRELIRGSTFAASTSESRVMLTGCMLERDGKFIRMVALDGYRMAMRQFALESAATKKGGKAEKDKKISSEKTAVVIPAKALNDFSRFTSEGENDVEISVSRSHAAFEIQAETGKMRFISRVLNGEFMDYTRTLPNENECGVTVETSALIRALERTTLVIASDQMRSPLRMNIGGDGIHMSCATIAGKAEDHVQAEISGNPLEIGFNHRFLIEAVRNADAEKIHIQFAGSVRPCLIQPAEGDDFKYVVLPVRL